MLSRKSLVMSISLICWNVAAMEDSQWKKWGMALMTGIIVPMIKKQEE